MTKPEELSMLLHEAFAAAAAENFERTAALAVRVLEQDPKNADGLYLRIFSLRKSGHVDEARESAEDALKLLPEDVKLWVERGLVEHSDKDYKKAIGFFDDALKLKPAYLKALRWKSTALRQLKRFDEARSVINDALALAPADAALLEERAFVAYDQKDYEQALGFFNEALKHEPANLEALRGKSTALRRLKRFDEARSVINDALALAPADAALLKERAFVAYDQKEYEQALGFFNEALKHEPTDAYALEWRIASLRSLKRFGEARTAADTALELLPDKVQLLTERALIDYDQENYERAVELFDQVLKREPGNIGALQTKIRSLCFLKHFEVARRVADDARKSAPDDVDLLIERAFVDYDQKEYEKAIGFFDQVLKKDPKNVESAKWKIASLRGLRRFETAKKEADNALTLAPDDVPLLIERAWVDYDQHEYEKAITFLEEALKHDPDDATALRSKISSLRQLRRFEAADKAAATAINLHPTNASLRVERGLIYLDQEDLPRAERLFSEAAELATPYDHSALFGQVETFLRQNRSDEAVKVLQTRVEAYPHDADLRFQLGWTHMKRNDLLNAKKEFEIILAKKSDSAAAINGLGAMFFSQGEYPKAEEQFRKVVEIEPSEATWANLAWSLARQQPQRPRKAPSLFGSVDRTDRLDNLRPDRDRSDCLSRAEESCRKALQLSPNYASAFGCLGVIAFKRGQLRESEDHFLRSTRANKRDGCYVDLAALYVVMGRYDDAEVHLKTALELDRNDVMAHIERGNLLLQQENAKEAIREFRQAASIDQNNETAQRALALALIQAGALDEAEKLLRSALRRMDRPKRWSLHLTLGQLLEKRGDETEDNRYYDEGLGEVHKAMDIKRDDAQLHFQAGILRSKSGDYASAVRSFKRCLQLDPDHFQAERNLTRLKPLLPGETVKKLATAGGICLGAISLLLLSILWLNFFNPYVFTSAGVKISDATLITMTPIFLGLIVVGLLLPALVRLKLPGVEAELSQPKLKETLSVGPRGPAEGSSLPNISSGPR